jgi:DNA-binding transcriptional regulator YiaG
MSTNTDQTAGVIIKSDHCGRSRYTSQYKQEVLCAFESSSLSAPDFARQCGIKYSTLAAWDAARGCGKAKPSRKNTPAFLLAEVSEQTASLSSSHLKLKT